MNQTEKLLRIDKKFQDALDNLVRTFRKTDYAMYNITSVDGIDIKIKYTRKKKNTKSTSLTSERDPCVCGHMLKNHKVNYKKTEKTGKIHAKCNFCKCKEIQIA